MPLREGANAFDSISPAKLSKSTADKYRIIVKLAVGGMGEIYIAADNNCRRQVVVKAIRENLKSGMEAYRFIIEAQITAQLEHPNIVPIHDLGVDKNDRLFYSMKRVKGDTLLHILSKLEQGDPEFLNRFPLDRLLNIFQDVCDAIAFAHSRGVIHRDLKPENIMVGGFGEVLVLDWGIAKVLDTSLLRRDVESCIASIRNLDRSEDENQSETPVIGGHTEARENVSAENTKDRAQPTTDANTDEINLLREKETGGRHVSNDTYGTLVGDVFGTMGYMSPEQREGRVDELDARSDVFSLGVILYFILTLRLPFGFEEPEALYQNLKNEGIIPPVDLSARKVGHNDSSDVPKPSHCPGKRVPSALSAVTMKAMECSPLNRYESIAALQEDIRKYQAGFATSAEDAGALKLLLLLINRHRILATSALIIVMLTITFTAQVMKSEKMARHQQHLAEKHATAAKNESLKAKLQFAQSLIAEGDALGALNKWGNAARKYRRSFDILDSTHVSTFPAQLGLWNAFKHSPPPVTSFPGHTSPALSVAISPAGDIGVSGSSDGRLIVWDLRSGRAIAELWQSNYNSPVVSVTVTRDNNHVLAGHYDGAIVYWDINKRAVVRTLREHSRWINDISSSPVSDVFASAGADGLVIIWNIETGEKISEIGDDKNAATDLAFSRDGNKLLTGGGDYSVRLWDIATGEQLQRFDGNEAVVSAVAFGVNDESVISGNLNGVIRLWNTETGAPISRLNGRTVSVLDIGVGANGRSLVCAHQDLTLTLWNISKQIRIWEKYSPGWAVLDLAFSADGEIALTNGPGNTLNLIAAHATREVKTLSGHTGTIVCTAFSSDGRLIVSGSWDKTIKLWDVATGRLLKTLSGHRRAVTSVAFLGDSASTGIPKDSAGTEIPKDSANAGFPGNSTGVVSTSLDGTLRQWDLYTGNSRLIEVGYGPILHAAYSQMQTRALFSNREGDIVVWDLKENVREHELKGNTSVRRLSFSADGTVAFAIFTDGNVRIWSIPDYSIIRELSIKDSRSAVLSPDAALIVIGTRTGNLEAWDIQEGTRIVTYHSSQTAEITSLRYGPEGRYLYSTNRNAFLQVWNADTGELVGEFKEHDRPIATLAVSADGFQLITGGRDKDVKHWDVSTPLRYAMHQDKPIDVLDKASSSVEVNNTLATNGQWFHYNRLTGWAIDALETARDRGRMDVALSLARCYWQLGLREKAKSNFTYAEEQKLAPSYYLTLCQQALITD